MPDEHDGDDTAEALRDRLAHLEPNVRLRIEHILAVGKARATIHRILNDATDDAGPRVSFDEACRRLNVDQGDVRRQARKRTLHH